MARKNQVTLTFAGDSKSLETAFGRVGDAAKGMDTDVGRASRGIRDSAGGLDRFGEASDTADTRAMGFRDTLTGVEDTGRGLSMLMRGDLFDGALMLGMGFGDLGSGIFNFVVPAMKSLSIASLQAKLHMAAQTAGMVVGTAVGKLYRVGLTAMTIAQHALNAAMRANPIGIVITVLAALAAGIVIAWKRSETFRNVVSGAMRGVAAAFGWVIDRGAQLLGWFRALPGRIGGFFSGLARTIKAPFIAAFNAIKSFWNNNVAGFGFTAPGWLPVIGGNSFRIPRMHTGGIVPGAPGSETMALLQAGERVTPPGRSGAPIVLEVRSSGTPFDDFLVEALARAVRVRGGDVAVVLGGTGG